MDYAFDNIISLGYDCETAYSIEAIYGKVNSNLFNWVYVGKFQNLLNFLNNPDILLSKGLVYDNKVNDYMYYDSAADFWYYTKKKLNDLINRNGEPNFEAIEEDKKEIISRMTYLKNKFLNMLRSDARNLFVLRYKTAELSENTPKDIIDVSNVIKNISKNKDFKILVVLEKKPLKKKNITLPQLDNVIYEKIDKFAPSSENFNLRFSSWEKIYKKFIINGQKPNRKERKKEHRNI